MRKVLRDILEEAGHDVVGEAKTGEEAVELYRTHRPDVVTMDLVMPGKGGLAATEAILTHDPAAQVVVVSAVGQKADLENAIAIGASDYLVKPFEKETVLATVRRLAGATAKTRR